MQRFVGIGIVSRDPVLRYTTGNRPQLALDMRFDDSYKDKRTSLWIDVICWDGLATTLHANVRKGDRVFVEGTLVRVEFTLPKRPGDTRTRIDIRAFRARLIDPSEPPEKQSQLPLKAGVTP